MFPPHFWEGQGSAVLARTDKEHRPEAVSQVLREQMSIRLWIDCTRAANFLPWSHAPGPGDGKAAPSPSPSTPFQKSWLVAAITNRICSAASPTLSNGKPPGEW